MARTATKNQSADAIRAQLVQAMETMQTLIKTGASFQTMALQERRVNRLRTYLRDAEAREFQAMTRASRTVIAVAVRLGVDAADIMRSLGAGVGPATRLNDREISFLTAAFGR